MSACIIAKRPQRHEMLTMVASVATLKPLPSVVSSVLGASDGGESRKLLLTPDNCSVIGTSDLAGWPPNSLDRKLLAPDCTSLSAGSAAAEELDVWNCLRFDVRGRRPLHHRCDMPATYTMNEAHFAAVSSCCWLMASLNVHALRGTHCVLQFWQFCNSVSHQRVALSCWYAPYSGVTHTRTPDLMLSA